MSRTATYIFIGLGLALHVVYKLAKPLAIVNFEGLLSPEDVRRF